MKTVSLRTSLLVLALLSLGTPAWAALTWPEEQLLPSFPSPAANLDLFTLRGPASSPDELAMFASLKGAVNVGRPRVFSYEGDAFAEGPHAWLQSLGLTWTEVSDNWTLVGKYRGELGGVVVYDPAVPDTLNLATTLAGRARALVASPALLPRLTGAPYNLPILEDLRGRFANKLAVYRHLRDVVWPTLTHRVVVGLSPEAHRAGVREYAAALGAAVIWLDPRTPGESALLDEFLAGMDPGAAFMGWWPEEQSGVERASRHGIATVASDFATNLTVHGGMPRKVDFKPIPAKPILENKLYVAFWISDGDNLQYVEHLMRKLWNDGARGKVPMGWTVSPAMLDAMPAALDYYHRTASAGDVLISGPSGWGYAYPNSWRSPQTLARFLAKSDDYALRAGLRIVTVWNTITGGIDPGVGSSYAANAPSLLGLSAQNTGGGLTVYDGKLPAFALSCNYCTNEQAVKDFVAMAAKGWDRTAPRFILIQAQPWQGVTPTTFANVRDGLGPDYAVVRPDSWFQLLRQANRLPIEPLARLSDGVHRIVSSASGKCVARRDGKVEQVACADDEAQRWRVVTTDAGFARVQATTDATILLNVEGAGDGPLAVAGRADQQWQAVWEAGFDYHLIARHSDRCLEVPGGTDVDVQLRQWTCTGAGAQAFRFADAAWPSSNQGDAAVPAPDAGADAGSAIETDGGPRDAAVPSGDAGGVSVGVGSKDAGTDRGAGSQRRSGCSVAASEGLLCWPAVGLLALVLLGAAHQRRRTR
jgi:hypothetical protein